MWGRRVTQVCVCVVCVVYVTLRCMHDCPPAVVYQVPGNVSIPVVLLRDRIVFSCGGAVLCFLVACAW